MIPPGITTVAYIAAAALFILSLGGLSQQETARRGNACGIAGMIIAVLATALSMEATPKGYMILLLVMLVGAAIGALLALRVVMTAMPQLVAILHSFVGLAAVLVGFNSYLEPHGELVGGERTIHLVEIGLGVFIGAITFTGSVIAYGKLQGKIRSAPLLYPFRHGLNLAMAIGCIALTVAVIQTAEHSSGLYMLVAIAVIASILGVLLVMAIGGADMPVVVSMLNSYSGWAAAAAGFMLSNDLLIVTGALVGSSGAILSYIMCKAMNRSIVSVIFGGFGTAEGTVVKTAGETQGEVIQTSSEEVAEILAGARRVIIVPGYGMAVARAQHSAQELMESLKALDIEISFAVHPVAGRLPGHMNVLLAEANVPYDIVHEMEDINEDFSGTDVVLVVGANDIVNPSALEDEGSPIFGMPVIEAWRADVTVVLKRSMATGYAGIANPLYFKSNTRMLFGDARDSLSAIVSHMRK